MTVQHLSCTTLDPEELLKVLEHQERHSRNDLLPLPTYLELQGSGDVGSRCTTAVQRLEYIMMYMIIYNEIK